MYRWQTTRAALAQRLVAVIRMGSYDHAAAAAGTLLSAGLTAMEISLTTPFALEAVTTMVREVGEDAVIGAGTVLDATAARLAVEAGARYLSAPHLDPEVIRTAHRYGVPVFVGAATPGEVVRALELGADAIKLFPASAVSPEWIRGVRAALPQAPLIATGGVTAERAPEWIEAGAVACAIGTGLTAGDRDTVLKRAADLLARLADLTEREEAAPPGEEAPGPRG